MDSIVIQGGQRLEGIIPISGAKNSALTLLPCAILTDEKLTLSNLPRLADVDSFGHLLNELGVSTKVSGARKGDGAKRRMTLEAGDIASTVAPYDMVRKMRASILVLGPMLARTGESTVSLPGGCAIGDSPTTGVVDPYQRVYGYEGLHVVDGSTVSANLGVNPSLTITAQAERAMAFWPNKGEVDGRPAVGAAYVRMAPVEPKNPVVPEAAPGALRLPIVGVS